MAASKAHGRALWKAKTSIVMTKNFKKGELEKLCPLDFHFKGVKNRFKKLDL